MSRQGSWPRGFFKWIAPIHCEAVPGRRISGSRSGSRRCWSSPLGCSRAGRSSGLSSNARCGANSARKTGSRPSSWPPGWPTRSAPRRCLLDVRTPAEWEVSHLAGARLVDPKADANSAAGDLAKDTPIVTYCAVGYRSGVMAQRLRAAAFTKVQNLEGSIFQWANEHRPLVRDGQRVTRVHPISAARGRLLEPEVRAPLPAE